MRKQTEEKKWYNTPPESKERANYLLHCPLEEKIYWACSNISNWDIFSDGKWYISFSGGKDSTVLTYIAAKMLNNSPVPRTLHVLFIDTGLEYPEIRKFVYKFVEFLRNKFQKVEIDFQRKRPAKNIVDVIKEVGYPIISKGISQIAHDARSGGEYSLARLNGTYEMKTNNNDFLNAAKYKFLLDAPFYISNRCCNLTKKRI